MYREVILLIILVSFSQLLSADTFVRDDLITEPKPGKFSFCYHGTCEETKEIGLNKEQWQRIRDEFTVSASAQIEREKIKQAVALMEKIVGNMTGTNIDKAGTFARLGEQGQLDCIDESINTTFYIQMMVNDGLIVHHTVADRTHRGFFLNGWPHSAAAIRETGTGKIFVVDSWFEDNGKHPHILPYQQWDDGWKPAQFKE